MALSRDTEDHRFFQASVNLTEDGQSMTCKFLNGLCKLRNNLQPRATAQESRT